MIKLAKSSSILLVNSLIILPNCVFLYFFQNEYPVSAGSIYLSILSAGAIGAIVQRLRFGRQEGWRIRYAPSVTLAFMLGFNLVLVPMALFGPR